MTEVTFRGRRSTLRALDVWTRGEQMTFPGHMNANVHKTKYSDFTAVMALFQTLVGSLFFLTTMFSRELILSLSWQAQDFVRLLRCGSAIFVAGARTREVARCDGGHISWQAQYFVRVRRVDAW